VTHANALAGLLRRGGSDASGDAGRTSVLVPGVFDALSARLAERAGFECLYLSGSATAAAAYGLPDFGIIGRQELKENCQRISAAVEVPVIADADTGYGGPSVVRRTVVDLIRAGAAAITLEDQIHQKQCGNTKGVQVVDITEMQRRLESAVRARGADDLVIIGRTDALPASEGISAAMKRATAMLEAGADVAWILGLQNRDIDELAELRRAIPGPAMIDYTELPDSTQHSFESLAAAGFEIVLTALSGVLASAKAMDLVYRSLRSTGDWMTYRDQLLDFEEYNELAGFGDAVAFEAAVLSRQEAPVPLDQD
jgi:2-methylisocitrate lyase-like PEP mutase family enzyme